MGAALLEMLRRRAAVRMVDFGFISAQREVADAEASPGFRGTQDAYLKIARALEERAREAVGGFARPHQEIARLVRRHAAHLG